MFFSKPDMAKTSNTILALFLSLALFCLSCTKNDDMSQPTPIGVTPDPDPEPEPDPDPNPSPEPTGEIAGDIEYFNKDLVYDGYVLVNDARNNSVFLMNKDAEIFLDWNLNGGDLGNDCFLQNDGMLLSMIESDDPKILIGGFGGRIQLLDKDGGVNWDFIYSTNDKIIHHDAEMLPNGNILIMTWERKSNEQAIENGYKLDVELFPDGIIEVNPNTDQIVWQWDAWDHLIQDHDDTKSNFGIVSENPQRIDINYGNPKTYNNNIGQRLFYNNHYPNLIDAQNGKLLIFSNGNDIEQSTAYELKLPIPFDLKKDTNNEPEVVWSFTDPDLYSPKVSGVVLLPNGNRLITEGDFGIWEVTEAGEVVWKFQNEGFYWRSYSYAKDHPAIKAIGL